MRDVILISEHKAKLAAAQNRADVQGDTKFLKGFGYGALLSCGFWLAAFAAYLWLS